MREKKQNMKVENMYIDKKWAQIIVLAKNLKSLIYKKFVKC